jgi:hypothetical protein
MVTITLMGDLQTTDGERSLGCEVEDSITVKQLIRKQGKPLREIFQLLKQKKVMVTVNKRIARLRSMTAMQSRSWLMTA